MKCILENQTLMLLFPNLPIVFYSVFVLHFSLFQKHTVAAWCSAIISSYSTFYQFFFFQLECASVYKSYSYLRNFSLGLIKLPPDQSLLLFIGHSVVSEHVWTVNITEWILAWPHQYNTGRGAGILPYSAPYPSDVDSEKTYSTVRKIGSVFILMITVYT